MLRSRSQATADAMVAGLAKSLAKQVEKGKRTEAEARRDPRAGSRPPPTSGELADCDLVIESVVEDLGGEEATSSPSSTASCKPDTILATNTSTLPVVEMAMETGRPDKVCGIHFFNPAPAMSLVEVVRPITAARRDHGGGHGLRRARAARTRSR